MIEVRFEPAERPICPHCRAALNAIDAHRVRHDLGKSYVHSCPNCHRVLGVTHRKGFWMG